MITSCQKVCGALALQGDFVIEGHLSGAAPK